MCCAASHCGVALRRSGTITRRCPTPSGAAWRKGHKPARRKTTRLPSEIPLIRAKDCAPPTICRTDEATYSSFKQHCTRSICCFPSGCTLTHPSGPAGYRQRSHRAYPVLDGITVHDPTIGPIKRTIQLAREETEIFPHVNNYNSKHQDWDAKWAIF